MYTSLLFNARGSSSSSRQVMTNIPPEIWLHVSKFIPKEDLLDLLGVNSFFFNIAMDIRYREIVISTTTLHDIMKFELETLKRISNPFVAFRVYRLELRLGDIKKVLGSDANTSSSRIRRQLKHTITRVFGGPKLSPTSIAVSVTGLIKDIIKIINKLVNVRELCIDLWDLAPSYDLQPLFLSFWSSFGPKLHTLSLNGNLENFRTLIQNPKLDGLQELCVEFTGTAGRAIIVDVLLPFINSLAPHLLSLRLWCRPSLDLSTFFAQLAPFPDLKSLIIHTPFKKAFGNTSGLEDVIHHSTGTVQRVHLCLNPAGLTVDSEEPLSRLSLEYISNITRFSYLLQILDLYPTDMDAGMEILLDCIERTSQSLAELNVRDRYLQDGGMEAIINVASSYSNLVYLKMNIRKLDVALTDHLALNLKLPKIDQLRLSIREYAVDDPQYLVNAFVQDLDMRSYLYQLEVVGPHHLEWSGRVQ